MERARGAWHPDHHERETGNLELAVDVDLPDQALLNLVRNAIDALLDTQNGVITLSACDRSRLRMGRGWTRVDISSRPGGGCDRYAALLISGVNAASADADWR